jgi:hypothetical protein
MDLGFQASHRWLRDIEVLHQMTFASLAKITNEREQPVTNYTAKGRRLLTILISRRYTF